MKTMDDLRSVIFDTIDDVRKNKIDAATARAISDLAQNGLCESASTTIPVASSLTAHIVSGVGFVGLTPTV